MPSAIERHSADLRCPQFMGSDCHTRAEVVMARPSEDPKMNSQRLSARAIIAVAVWAAMSLALILFNHAFAQVVTYSDEDTGAAAAQAWAEAWRADVPQVGTSGQIDCPPIETNTGNVLQVATSGVYESLADDGTAFDLSIGPAGPAGFDLYVTVREQNGLWFEGSALIGPSDKGAFVPLFSPLAPGDPVRWLTLCSTPRGVQCKNLSAAVWRQDGQPNTTPTLTAFFASRSHNSVTCVKALN